MNQRESSPLEIDHDLIREAYARSLHELRFNSSPWGFLAARQGGKNYNAVWGRDGAITAIASFETADAELIETGVRTLQSLAEHQARNGQIPSYLSLMDDEIVDVVYGGLGNITSIDANLWFIIACQTAVEKLDRREFLHEHFREVYRRAMRHLASIDSDCCGLLEIPVAGDWSDLLDRSYHILYDQVLWWRVLSGAVRLIEWCDGNQQREFHKRQAEEIGELLNDQFWWDQHGKKSARESYMIGTELPPEEMLYYQCYLQPFHNTWYERFDSLGNVLTALSGLAPRNRAEIIAHQVTSRKLDRPAPLRVLDPVVQPGDDDWLEMYKEKQPPYAYHNGGIWPLAGGLWVSLLAKLERRNEALTALTSLARSLKASNSKDVAWGFHEYLHGQTGEPMGRRHQAWSAASFIMAYHAAVDHRFACFEQPIQ